MMEPIRTANGFQQRPYQTMEYRVQESDLSPQINDLIKHADKDKTSYIGNPANVRQPSFAAAINGIENGDYEGLEMLDFGALADGTPAVSFLDEDGQRQVIRMTTPQWLGAMEFRSKARMELNRERELVAKRESFKPYFNSLANKVGAANDPDIGGYLAAMYQMDPQMAIEQLGQFQRQQSKQDAETVVWRGKPVPVEFARQALKMEQDEFQQGERAFDSAMKAYEDQPYAAPMIENIRSLRRKPTDYQMPSTATLVDALSAQNAGPLPLVTLFHAMTKPMMTPLPQPATLPRRGPDGQYNLAEVTNFLNNFNMVSQRLGWDQVVAADEVGLSAIIDALDIANNSQGLASKVVAPPERTVPVSLQRQQMQNEGAIAREGVRMGSGAPQAQAVDKEAEDEAALGEAIALLAQDGESDASVMMRLVDLSRNPNSIAGFSEEQKQLLLRASQIAREYAYR
jgi:hypothetical protein